jgi:hypothetical protein
MRALLLTILGLATLSMACDIMPGSRGGDAPTEPMQPVLQEPEGDWQYGVVSWYNLDTDCPGDAWSVEETAMVLVEGDQVTMVFETMPMLLGTLVDGRASVSGVQVFPGETGAEVTCIVKGNTAIVQGAMEGQMNEALSSDGDLNCNSTARYRLILDR